MNPAAKTETVLPLAAFFQLTENPHLGHQLPTAALYPGITIANSNTASSLRVCLYDSGRRSRSTGKERDAETGLDYFDFRYFSGAQGRFTSPDEVFAGQRPRDPQSWNLYSYALNSPLRYTDATGHEPCENGVNPQNGNICTVVTPKQPNPILNFFAGLFKGIGQAFYGFANLNGEMGMTQEGQQMRQSLQPTNSAQQRGVNVATIGALLVPGSEVEELNPASVMFSQRSVNGVEELTQFINAGGEVGPADVVRMADGSLVTLDNTRVLVASQQGTSVQAIVHDAGDPISPSRGQAFLEQYKTRPSTWGDAVQLRIGDQGSLFKNTYPNGSPVTGVH